MEGCGWQWRGCASTSERTATVSPRGDAGRDDLFGGAARAGRRRRGADLAPPMSFFALSPGASLPDLHSHPRHGRRVHGPARIPVPRAAVRKAAHRVSGRAAAGVEHDRAVQAARDVLQHAGHTRAQLRAGRDRRRVSFVRVGAPPSPPNGGRSWPRPHAVRLSRRHGGPRIHPCRRVQEALRAAGISYDKVIAAHGSPIPFLAKARARISAPRRERRSCPRSSCPTGRS